MANCINKQLMKYNHIPPQRQQDCPYKPNPRKYRKAAQDPALIDESSVLWTTKTKQKLNKSLGVSCTMAEL